MYWALIAVAAAGEGAVAVGDRAVIRRISSSGVDAPERDAGGFLWLRDVDFLDLEGYAVGAKSQVFRSVDGGHTWVDVSPGASTAPGAASGGSPE